MTKEGEFGIVVIGRNEGVCLTRCLGGLVESGAPVVYVDSGSEDGSAMAARGLGVDVIELDDSVAYTAARGRNTGFKHLATRFPQIRYVQFVDGDCVISPGWLESAIRALRADGDVVLVCGRRREEQPDLSVYNRLCDMEWDSKVGDAESCGGDFMVRKSAFEAVGGFDESLIAGEEPELCWRLRRDGGRIRRLAAEMTAHDAALESFPQWWRRQVRAGHAAAENADLHGREDPRHCVRAVASNVVYAVCMPVAAVCVAYYSLLAGGILALLVYSLLFVRVHAMRVHHGDRPIHAAEYALFTVIGKFAQGFGVAVYVWRHKIRKIKTQLIEYKGVN